MGDDKESLQPSSAQFPRVPEMDWILNIINTRSKKILVSVWALSSVITLIAGGGFATHYVSELAEGEIIPFKEKLNSIKSINVLNQDDGYLVSICFDAFLAYVPEGNNYQIDKFFKSDFTGGSTSVVPRDKIILGCNKIEGSVDLLANARSSIENSSEPYYKLDGIYCRPGKTSAMLALGCFMNPKQKRKHIEIALASPEHKYTSNSSYLILLPIAWIVDVLLAPVFIIFYAFLFAMYYFAGW